MEELTIMLLDSAKLLHGVLMNTKKVSDSEKREIIKNANALSMTAKTLIQNEILKTKIMTVNANLVLANNIRELEQHEI